MSQHYALSSCALTCALLKRDSGSRDAGPWLIVRSASSSNARFPMAMGVFDPSPPSPPTKGGGNKMALLSDSSVMNCVVAGFGSALAKRAPANCHNASYYIILYRTAAQLSAPRSSDRAQVTRRSRTGALERVLTNK